MLINRTSLSQTVDAITAAHVDARTLAAGDRTRAARWIAGRQGLPGAYGDMFAGFSSARSKGITLFTGERIASAAPELERTVNRPAASTIYARRQELAVRALNRL
jgi:hypothetical protein